MELRGCSHLHFISVIRGGEVINVPNISQQKKVLKFKNIVDVFLSDSKGHDSLAEKPPKVDRSLAVHYGCDQVKIEVKIESKEEESELDFGAMTLKQLQATCKSRKRKHSKSFNFAAVKPEDNDLQLEQDEPELKETLGSWKRKLYKKRKAKRSGITNCVSIISEANSSPSSRLKNTLSDLALQDTSNENFEIIRIKVEDPEPEYQQPQGPSCILSDDLGTLTCAKLGARDPCFTDRQFRTSLEDLQSVPLSKTSPEPLLQPTAISIKTQSCSLNQVSYDIPETIGLSHESHEHEECLLCQSPCISEASLIEDIIQINNTAVTHNQTAETAVLPVPEPGKVEDMTEPVTCDDAPETLAFECNSSNTLHILPCIDDLEVEGPGTTASANSCSSDEFDKNSEASGSIQNNNDLEAEVNKTVRDCYATVKSSKCPALANGAAPKNTLMSMVEDIHGHNIASVTYSPDMQPSNATDKVTGSAASESYKDKEVPHPPEKLFSTRKTISPDYQERLWRAMNSNDLQDDAETNYCEERSSSWSDIKKDRTIFTSEALNTTEISSNSRQTIQKGKDQTKGLRCRGIVKGPYASRYSKRAVSACRSVKGCSRNAVEFSQQQMHDIERLAMKLVTELQSMKEIVVDALQCESRAGAKLRYNTHEVRVAAENATKVEETTRKWLSMMKKDCNRFCKIMRLAEANAASPEKEAASPEENAASPEKTVDKQRKIMFADEAGGRLCHIRVFKAFDAGLGVASPGESQIEKHTLGA